MLEALIKYAREHGLVAEPGFSPKYVRWAIVLDESGRFLDVFELGDPDQKRNPGQQFMNAPDLSHSEMVRKGGIRCHFLAETTSVVALYGKDAGSRKTTDKHACFIGLLRKAGEAVPVLRIIADVLSDESLLQAIRERLADARAKETDKVTFRVGGVFPLESDAWHDWWRDFRKAALQETGNDKELMRCFATGELVEPATTHFKIKGLANVGGNAQGDVLIGFDKDSFRSYGFEQSMNAAVSENAASAYRASLNHLVENHSQRIAGAKIVHWFRNKISDEDDPLKWLEEGEREEELQAQNLASRLLRSIRDGQRPDLHNNYYYAIALSGAAGRIMVRDWIEGPFVTLVSNIDKWFEDLSIVNLQGTGLTRLPGIERIITCVLPPRKQNQKYKDWIKPIGSERLEIFKAATTNQPIPNSILTRVVIQQRNTVVSGNLEETLNAMLEGKLTNDQIGVLSATYARLALMKVYLRRSQKRRGGMAMSEMILPRLNRSNMHPAYQCGRLMAMLADLQHSALGNVGAGIVQRYYSAACTTPSLVLGRLTSLSQHHLSQLSKKFPGKARWYEDELCEIWRKLGDSIPRTLDLEEQSLFALGYYQQIADVRKGKDNQLEKVKEACDD